MSATRLSDSQVLQNMQRAVEAQGMKFYFHPQREVVPDFLGDYQPDALALGPDGGIVVGVTRPGSPVSNDQLSAIAKKVSAQKGWEFRAFYLSAPADETPPIETPTPEQLEATFREIEALAKGGHTTAAFITAWAALEALARLASDYEEAERGKVLSPLQSVQRLAEEGYLENDVADRLRRMVRVRNAVVHGDLSVGVSVGEVEGLLRIMRAVASEIVSVGLALP